MIVDINPYRLAGPDGAPGVVELPWQRSLDDAPFALFAAKTPRPIFTSGHIRDDWQEEFREIRRWGGFYNLVMHLQFTGRPSHMTSRVQCDAGRRSRSRSCRRG